MKLWYNAWGVEGDGQVRVGPYYHSAEEGQWNGGPEQS